jgi:hypothetical protein
MKRLPCIVARGAIVSVLLSVAIGCGGSAADPTDEAEDTGSAAQADSPSVSFNFGGAYGYINDGTLVPNPATGAASCPAGYTATQVLGTYNTDWPVFYCWQAQTAGTDPIYDFGGMWGYVTYNAVPNAVTGDTTCPVGFTSQVVLGTYNQDYQLTVCYRAHAKGNDAYANFGGMYGFVGASPVANPATGASSCPAGYLSSQVLGSTNVDWPLFYCYQPVAALPLDFGGMWGWVQTQEVVNPATGAGSCPAGYNATPAFGTYNVDYPVYYCWRPHLDGRAPVYDFGGMWGYVNAAPVVNPTTGQTNCPAGYTQQQLLGTMNVDYALYGCYRPHQAGAPAALFGGMVGTTHAVAANDPASGASSCSSGYTAKQVMGTYNVDYYLAYCYETPSTCPAGQIWVDSGCEACPAGQITTDHVTCNACPAGEMTTDNVTCTPCPAGQNQELDQQATTSDNTEEPWGSAPMAQVFTAGVTGYLTQFAYAGSPCWAAWNVPCTFTLELHTLDGNGNPGALLWSGKGQQPQPNSPQWYDWSTTVLANPPFVDAGTKYAIVIRLDSAETFAFGTGSSGHAVAWYPQYGIWSQFPDDLLFQTWVTPAMCQ